MKVDSVFETNLFLVELSDGMGWNEQIVPFHPIPLAALVFTISSDGKYSDKYIFVSLRLAGLFEV